MRPGRKLPLPILRILVILQLEKRLLAQRLPECHDEIALRRNRETESD
jgi:hypothetical protein